MRSPTGSNFGIVFAVLAAVLWSTGGFAIAEVSGHGLAIAGIRSAIATPVLLAAWWGLSDERRYWRARLRDPQIWGVSVMYALTVVLFVWANKLTTSAHAILLQYTAPFWVALLSWPLLRERVVWADLLAVAGVATGVWVLSGAHLSELMSFGNGIAVLSGVTFAFLTLGTRSLARRSQSEGRPEFTSSLLGNTLAALITLPWMVSEPAPSGFGALVYLGVFQIGLAYVCFSIGIRRIPALLGTLIASLEPVLNPLWVALWTGTVVVPAVRWGGIWIVTGVVLSVCVKAFAELRTRKSRDATLRGGL